MNLPEFPTVFRGYDPVQVDQHLAALQQAADAARQEAAESSVELTKLRQSHEALTTELADQRRSLSELEDQSRKVSSPTFVRTPPRVPFEPKGASARDGLRRDQQGIGRNADRHGGDRDRDSNPFGHLHVLLHPSVQWRAPHARLRY
jgi:DivIVA domain-containing protein